MQRKLTLRLDESLIKKAKVYAKQQDKSLSNVVSDYFLALINEQEFTEIPPVTKSLIGVLGESEIEIDDYKKHLEEKYL